MTSVFEVQRLTADYATARAVLRTFVESTMADGRTLCLRAGVGPATVTKNVIVSFERASDGTRFDEVWSIRWTPENGGPFPDFSGRLSVQYVDDGCVQLEIRGEYTPPFGAIGQGFDLTVGQRIAARTCKNLLVEIAERIDRSRAS